MTANEWIARIAVSHSITTGSPNSTRPANHSRNPPSRGNHLTANEWITRIALSHSITTSSPNSTRPTNHSRNPFIRGNQQAAVRKQKAGASHERWGRPQPETRRSCPRATGRPCRGTTLRHTYFRSTNPRPSARNIYPHSNPPTTPTHCLPNPTPLRRWPRPGTSAPALSASGRSLLCWPAPGQSRRCPRGTNLYQTSHQPFPQHDENCRQTNYFFQTKHQPSPQNGGSWRG